MKILLAALKAGQEIMIGKHAIYLMSDGKSIGIRLERSLSTMEPATVAGLERLLAWMDKETQPKQEPLRFPF